MELLRSTDFGKQRKKVVTPIKEPSEEENDTNWKEKKLVMVVGHQGSGMLNSASHYISFVKVMGTWWRVDTGTQTISEENPFKSQITSTDEIGFTINCLLFKNVR